MAWLYDSIVLTMLAITFFFPSPQSYKTINPRRQTVSIMKLALLAGISALPLGASEDAGVHLTTRGEMSTSDRTLLSFLGESPHGRNEVVDLIVNEYTAIAANWDPSDDTNDWLEKAIDAIDISEFDAEPTQVREHDFLFLGSVGEYTSFVKLIK